MRIVCLIENVEGIKGLATEHGLSLYIETNTHKILFDTGESDLFIVNAEKLGIDLREVDLMVLSHGHKDHGGGIKAFMTLNSKARIYMQREAFTKHYSLRPNNEIVDISIDQELKISDRIGYVDSLCTLDEELTLFSGVHSDPEALLANRHLRMENNGELEQDDFKHELNLVIDESGTKILIAGCAHNGIENILNAAERITHRPIDVVIGGFHLQNRTTHLLEAEARIQQLATGLKMKKARFWTGHCTGVEAYHKLHTLMGDKISYLATGETVFI